MKKTFLLLFLLMGGLATAQNAETVVFNYERSSFDDNNPLPAAKYFTLTGPVNSQVAMVELLVYPDGGDPDKKPLYRNTWKSNYSAEDGDFYLPVNYKLRGGDAYDLYLNYYRPLSQREQVNLRRQLYGYLDAYIDQQVIVDGDDIELRKNPHQMVRDMNAIVASGLSYYMSDKNIEFRGFSDLVKEDIQLMREADLDGPRFLFKKKDKGVVRQQNFEAQVNALKQTVRSEADIVLNSGLLVLGDSKKMGGYPVEETFNTFTLHAGYAGTYLDGDVDDDFEYGSSFIAGITFPLGKRAFASQFWSNSAFVAGVYLENFERDGGGETSGPIVQRPFYFGLGYKVFRFARLTAGATFLEDESTAGGLDNLTDRVFVRPFVGLQIEINLWADLAD